MRSRAQPRESAQRAKRSPLPQGPGSRGTLVVLERSAWFTPSTLASYLQVSDRMVRKWVEQGRLRSYKIDGCRRFNPADVDAFVAQFIDERDIEP
jgi:excisionase family DNA binding protein